MNNDLANLIFRASGYFTGARPDTWLKRMEAMQWWDAARMRGWQEQELDRITRHAVTTVPYYQRVAQSEGIDPDDQRTPRERLAQFPVLTKDLMREHNEALQSTVPPKHKPFKISTSGSTGKPLSMLVNMDAVGRYFAVKLRALGWYGVRFADRQIRVWGFPLTGKQRFIWRARDLFQNRLRLVSFDLSAETLADFYDEALKFQPRYINGYTSGIYRLSSFIEETGRDGKALGLKLIVPTSEILYDWQREQMERAFGCPVMNEYGSGEAQAVAYECPEGRRLHVTHENFIVEVLDEQGRPALPGEPGLLTLTSFCNTVMPLLRYQNGDLVVEEPGMVCECGRHRGLSGFVSIVGRSADVLLRGDGEPTHWTTIYYAIKEAFTPEMVVEHQARQKALDLIELQVVKGSQYEDSAMEKFLNQLKGVLGQNVQIHLKFVDEIPREKSGKLRYFISDIKQAQQRSQPVP
ncbi:MAG TPA: hypothetical protein VF707_00520 [Ardenticatenaceae bacterium]|jgi:phenylacetate-CoA ligase